MRQIQISFPTLTANGISATQSITASGGGFAIFNGTLANINNINIPSATTASGQFYAPVSPGIGIARPVVLFATTTATGVVVKVTGKDLLGNIITASFVGASGGAGSTATDVNNLATSSGTDFAVVTAVNLSASMANFSIGFGATGETQWIQGDQFVDPFNMSISIITASSQPVTVQDTPDNVNTVTSPNIFNHATLVSVTTNSQSNYAFPILFTRAVFAATGQATGPSTVYFKQAGV